MKSTNTNHRPENQNKYSDYQSVKNQVPTVFKSFFDEPKTMKEVELDTNIDRAHICRYVATFLKEYRIAFTRQKMPSDGKPCRSIHHKPRVIPEF